MKDSIWDILNIEPIKDKKKIKRAYAAALKTCHPEEHPEEFKKLHDAYEQALKYAEIGAQNEFCKNAVIKVEEGTTTEEIIDIIKEVVNKEIANLESVNIKSVHIEINDNRTAANEKSIYEETLEEIIEPENERSSNGENGQRKEQEKITSFFAARENEKTENMQLLNQKLEWFRGHWNEEDAQNAFACYLSSNEFASIREEPETLRQIYYGLCDRRGIFGDAIKNAIWEQYGFSMDKVLSLEDVHYNIYRILLREQKNRVLEERNMQFRLMKEECDRLAAKKRAKVFKIIALLAAIIFIPVFIKIAANNIKQYQTIAQIKKEHEAQSDTILALLQEKYPNMQFGALEVQAGEDRAAYEINTTVKDTFDHKYKIVVDVCQEENGGLHFTDNLGEKLIDRANKDNEVSLALGSNIQYIDEVAADTLLVAYYTEDETNMEQLYEYFASEEFKKQFQWADEVLFCYEDAVYERYFFEGGEGGLPIVLRYQADGLPEKEQFMEDLYLQGLFYYFHYVPWQMKQELLDECTELYNAAAASFDLEQNELLEAAEAAGARELVNFAAQCGVKLLLFEKEGQLYITDGDLYRLLVAADADVERNSQHTGFQLQLPNGKIYLFGAGVSSHITSCRTALSYLDGVL